MQPAERDQRGRGVDVIGTEGFLSYLVTCNLEEREYRIYGYKGKQVRDNIHAEDVARFIFEFFSSPRVAEVYNIGGGKANSCSIVEAIELIGAHTGKTQRCTYVHEPRPGDHICYYSDLRKVKSHYPNWDVAKSLDPTLAEIVEAWRHRAPLSSF